MADKYLDLVEGLKEISRYVENTMAMHDLKMKKKRKWRNIMSNLTNESIKESIAHKIGSMTVNDLLDDLKSRPGMDLDYETVCIAIDKLFDIMWEEYPDE